VNARPRRRVALAVIPLAALGCVLISLGCGKKGPPVAPERRLPAAAAGLQASIDGPAIVVSWSNPTRRLDNTPLRDLTVVKLHRRQDNGAGEPKAAMLSRGQVVGYEQIATIHLDGPGPARPSSGQARPGAGHVRASGGTWVDRQGLTFGRRYVYVVTAIDAAGRSSPPSERLSVEFRAAPAAPSSVAATADDGRVTLRWEAPAIFIDGTPVSGDVGYLVLRGATPEGPLAAVTPEPLPATSFTDSGLDNDTTYRYAVRAVRMAAPGPRAVGEASAPVSATPVDTTPPAAPSGLVAVPTPGAVRLSWNPSPDADVAVYAVYRAAGRGEFLRIGTTAAVTTVFTDREVTAGTAYRYVVTALDRARRPNESARSNEATAVLPQ
jgi:hypothetical protein